jgi:tRNA-Thr(GGU) m(6)t(6)A37 methyltransferase TsaA
LSAGPAEGSLVLEPIGVARTPFAELVQAPRQSAAARGVAGTIELAPGRGFGHALEGIETWSHLWIVWWFHRSDRTPRMKVSPPRSGLKLGVFATRAPHRPNPLGLSVVRLVRVEGLVLHVEDLDLVDGTPILDIKPYVPYADALPDASNGWLTSPADLGPQWKVTFGEEAERQLQWLGLSLGGAPHPYRRIRVVGDGVSVIAVKAWRARFRGGEGKGSEVVVERMMSGYRPKELASGAASGTGGTEEIALHRAFEAEFGR